MAEPNRDSASSQNIIDDALRLVDAVQRKLIVEGVRRGISGTNASPPSKDDVWAEAVKQERSGPERPPLEELMGIVRTAGPQVVGHLGRAGATLAGALGESLGVLERTLQHRAEEAQHAEESGDRPATGGPRPISRGE
ncbi:hypothetical protein [Allosalinactinospora lopnorensis]|uniref:hypothetical protein n=1 Tax=Allosalinactinospora lopnorensis TaxID=1352348 RepID=UPI000623F54F|nr:hypothetical protein [Allosalinactinospora lopnorensis]